MWRNTNPTTRQYKVPIESEYVRLIQLHLALTEYFDEAQIDQIVPTWLSGFYEELAARSGNKRDKVRELLLAVQRRGRISELIELARQMRAELVVCFFPQAQRKAKAMAQERGG